MIALFIFISAVCMIADEVSPDKLKNIINNVKE
jgi:hypothetical protein